MDRYRLIGAIVFLFIYLLSRYPWQTIVIAAIIVIAYLVLNNLRPTDMIERNAREDRRRMALKAASIYLSPYKNIWGNLKLSNKYCTIRLGSYSGNIVARDTINQTRSFRIIDSKVHSYEDLWNMFCLNFTHNTSFDELVEMADRFGAAIDWTDMQKNVPKSSDIQQNNSSLYKAGIDNKKEENKKELLDVNNASEVELTALPGISIVMAKKLIKKREEIDGFRSVSDVCLFLKLKPHMQTQLEKLICVKKMKGSLKINRYNERSVDI